MEVARLVIESTSPFVYDACASYLDILGPAAASTVLAIRPREPDFLLFCASREQGTVSYREAAIDFAISQSKPQGSAHGKPEPFRQLALSTHGDREVLLDFVRAAVEKHQTRTTAPRGHPGTGVMRYVWDDAHECWDSGKLIAHRPLSTLFLPAHCGAEVLGDLQSYLKAETMERYAALHIAPVRIYLLWGQCGSGKSSLVHTLASETGHNLAVLDFKEHTTDSDVMCGLRNLPPKTFLCIEDIDCLFDARANKSHGVSFSSLLTALDGMFGRALTVFMTTNVLDQLDPALRRRVDYAVQFSHATKLQCVQMFSAFFPHHSNFEAVWAHLKNHRFSMSVFQKFLVRAMHDKDPVLCLDTFQSLMHCTYGSGNNAENLYS